MSSLAASRRDAAPRALAGPLVLALVVAAFFGGACQADDLDDLIRNIERNEALYKNIEFTCKNVYVDNQPKEKTEGLPFAVTKRSEDARRLVYQGDKVFSRETSRYVTFSSDEEETSEWIYAWDGQVGHNLNGKLLHILDEPTDTTNWPRPHNLLLSYYRRAPLSVFCQGGAATRLIKGEENVQVDAEIVGRERIDGDECIKLKLLVYRDGRDPIRDGGVRLVWINPAKNYLPVRIVLHPANSTPDQMTSLQTVESMTTIEGGLWFPERIVQRTFDKEGQFRAGNPRNETTIVCSDIKLNPTNGPSLFGAIPVGIDVLTYRIQNGKIVETIPPVIPPKLPFLPEVSPRE